MQFICETSNKNLNLLLQPMNYTQLYNKLFTLLDEKEFQVFAKPNIYGDTTSWSTTIKGDYKVLDYDHLTEEQKDDISDQLEQCRGSIRNKISTNPEFEKVGLNLFTVPDSSDIKVIVQNNEVIPVLIRWGCSSNVVDSKIDPLSTLLLRPRSNTDIVSIQVMYSNGEKAADKIFYIEYNGRESKEKANAEGVYNRGRCKLNTKLLLYDIVGTNKVYEQELVVSKEASYVVTFPLLTAVAITLMDQHQRLLPGEKIQCNINGKLEVLTSNDSGIIVLEHAEVGAELTLTDCIEEQNVQKYMVNKTGNSFLFKLNRDQFAPVTIVVLNYHKVRQVSFELLIDTLENETKYTTDLAGEVLFKGLKTGTQIKVTNKLDLTNTETYTVNAGENIFEFNLPAEKQVSVKFIDRKNKPITDVKVDFTYNGATKSLVTNGEGVCILPYGSFIDREKVKVFVHMPKKSPKK